MKRRSWRAALLACTLLSLLPSPPARAQETTLLATYGPRAGSIEGDADFTQVIFIQIPASLADSVYVRLFDADVGGAHDALFGRPDTETRFSLYGGDGAFSAPSVRDAEPDAAVLHVGTLLHRATYGADDALDDRWQTFAAVAPDQGEAVGEGRIFRLVVEGSTGNDANLYDVAVSGMAGQQMPVEDVQLFTYSPTLRSDHRDVVVEMRFDVPEGADRLTVHNFDAAGATMTVETAYRSLRVTSSGQDEWRETTLSMLAIEQGKAAALTFAGNGSEFPNDGTFYVTGGGGRAVPIYLPLHAYTPHPRPRPALAFDPLADCRSVAFDASRSVDPAGNILAYAWNFGDGSNGEGRSPVHRYDTPGVYVGYLMITDASGRTGNGAAQSFAVEVKDAPDVDAGHDRVVAPGVDVAFAARASTGEPHRIARYTWDFDGGRQAGGQSVTHAFARPGTYTVTLRVEDDADHPCNAATDQVTVRVNAAPVAEAGEGFAVAAGETFTLDGRRSYDTDGDLTAYHWTMDDGSTEAGSSIQHAYDRPGTYEVALQVEDDAGVANSAATDHVTIVVNAPPVAEAGADRHVAIGEVIPFDASGSHDPDGVIRGFHWEFGDGGTANEERVPYAYRGPGSYRVRLTVTDDSGTRSNTDTDSVMVLVNAPPMAEAGSDQRVTTSEVRFDASASTDPDGRIVRYDWDFGDGTKGDGPSPTHVYRSTGTYHVRLSVTDDSGTIRNDHEDEVTVVVNAMPLADAGPDQRSVPGRALHFDGSGSLDPDGNVAAYEWDFGDGGHASGPGVSHAYDAPGTYTVRLAVRDDTGDERAVGFDEARVVVNAPPVAAAGPDVRVAPGDAVRLSGAQSFDPDGMLTAFAWDFSDGDDAASGADVTRSYDTPGVYTARLTVTDDSGVDNGTAQDQVTIYVNHAPQAAAGSDQHVCDATVDFDGLASTDPDGDALTYAWDLGDGTTATGPRVRHAYADGGSYPVLLTVDDNTGVSNARSTSEMVVRINRPPHAEAGDDRDVCAGDVVLFDGAASSDPEGGLLKYSWDLGDGTTAEGVNPTRIYKDGGVYPVRLMVKDDSGLQCSTDVDQLVVRVAESPIAVAGPDVRACTDTVVHFDGSASRDADGVVNRFSWDFGDGTRGGGSTPVHAYTEPGTYRVVLTIEGDERAACDNTDSDEMVVMVTEGPVAAFSVPERVALGASIPFDGSASTGADGRIVAYDWDFGDGQTATGTTVDHTFSQPGRYTSTLTIRTDAEASSCNTIATQQVLTVNAPPTADGGADRVVGRLDEVTFDARASDDADGAIVDYAWDFGDGTRAAGVEVTHRFTESGRYPVLLTVQDDAGLSNSTAVDTVVVTVNAAPQPVIAMPDRACVAEEVTFDAGQSTDPDGTPGAFTWRFGDGGTADGTRVTHAYDLPGTFAVNLMAEDDAGVTNSRAAASRSIVINRPPQAQAGPDRVVCAGTDVAFDGSRSVDWDGSVTRYEWEFGDGASASEARTTHRFDRPGTYDVQLHVTDDAGTQCSTVTDTVRVTVDTPPVAEGGADRHAFAGGVHDAVLFDATASSDADGQPLTYSWDFGDGSTGSGATLRHAYAAPGRYTVRFSASDGTGLACGTSVDEIVVDVRAR